MQRDDCDRRWRRAFLFSTRLWPALLLALLGLLLYGGAVCAAFPDGRAWEMVSPLNKNGGDIKGIGGPSGGGVIQASVDGEKITYVSLASFGAPQGAPNGSQYVSERDAKEGWLTQNISLPMGSQVFGLGGQGAPYDAFSLDLSRGLVFGGLRGVGEHPVETPPLVWRSRWL